MAKLLKLRRGTTSQHSSFTGAEGEVTVDTTKDTIVVHDGSTAAGRPLLREDLNNLANDAITLAHMAGIARGKIIYGDASGNPAVLAVGTADQVLTSDGTDIAWGTAAAGASGGNSGANAVFWENQQTVTHDFTITNNTNAGSFGPITVNSGVTVTIGDGENWTVI